MELPPANPPRRRHFRSSAVHKGASSPFRVILQENELMLPKMETTLGKSGLSNAELSTKAALCRSLPAAHAPHLLRYSAPSKDSPPPREGSQESLGDQLKQDDCPCDTVSKAKSQKRVGAKVDTMAAHSPRENEFTPTLQYTCSPVRFSQSRPVTASVTPVIISSSRPAECTAGVPTVSSVTPSRLIDRAAERPRLLESTSLLKLTPAPKEMSVVAASSTCNNEPFNRSCTPGRFNPRHSRSLSPRHGNLTCGLGDRIGFAITQHHTYRQQHLRPLLPSILTQTKSAHAALPSLPRPPPLLLASRSVQSHQTSYSMRSVITSS